jgi:CheY-like chemotaxis protein
VGAADPTRLVIDYADVDALVDDYLEDLSRKRARIDTKRELDVGDSVQLVLSCPGLRAPITIDGVVTGTEDECAALFLRGLEGADGKRIDDAIRRIQARDPRLVSRVVKVLVLEDNPHVLRIIREGLRNAGKKSFEGRIAFDVWLASTALEAIELLRSQRFALLIADIHLSGAEGTHVIAECRADPNLEAIPVIAVSAGADSTKRRALEAGANAFIAKPMRLLEIVVAMRQLLDLDD